MFKLALVLSTIPSTNLFRAALTGAFKSGYLDNFLICSGFFHERTNSRGAFYASDAFLKARLPDPSEVTVVGAYHSSSYEFDDFFLKLSNGLKTVTGARVPINQRRSIKKYSNHWHAKIFIAREGNQNRFAVVGSSNLTRSAFNSVASNNEADVLIWEESHHKTKELANSILADQKDPDREAIDSPTILVSSYDQGDHRNSTQESMNDRLQKLWQDVLSATA